MSITVKHPSPAPHSARVAAFIVAIVLALATLLATSSPPARAEAGRSQASVYIDSTSYVFVPIRLVCNDIEDAWPDSRDEINLYYGDQTFTDTAMWSGKVDKTLPTSTFTGVTLRLDLWEMDNGWTNHNHLGVNDVTSTDLGQERTVTFSGSGYSYDLVYKVIAG